MRIATIAGIDLRIHASFLILVVLVAVGSTEPGGPGVVAGLAWLVALFACVVAHEFAHSLVARRYSIPVLEIELLPIGGVSKMGRLPDDPRVEQRIALAGPLTSVALGLTFGAAALVAGLDLWPPAIYGNGLVARLAWVNLLLAAFNLVPALPLDGGRVLQAVLERRMDRERATHIAASVARVFAGLLIVAGLFFNLWLLIIGVFIYLDSTAEERMAAAHAALQDVRVRDVMIHDPLTLPAEAEAREVSGPILHRAQREFPVIHQGRCVGIVNAGALLGADAGTTVGAITDTAIPVLGPDDLVEESGLLSGAGVAVVVDHDRVIGLVRAEDAVLLAQRRLRRNHR